MDLRGRVRGGHRRQRGSDLVRDRELLRVDRSTWGFKYQDPANPYHMEGFVNSPGAVAGLEFYKQLYKCCTPPGYTNSYMLTHNQPYRAPASA